MKDEEHTEEGREEKQMKVKQTELSLFPPLRAAKNPNTRAASLFRVALRGDGVPAT